MGGGPYFGIIPAYAGLTGGVPPYSETTKDHPRLRGVNHEYSTASPYSLGSSPLTRG